MFARTDKKIDASTGKVLDEGGVRSMEIDLDLLLLSMFSSPEWNRTPLQQMIQRMYDERDEAVAVLATIATSRLSRRWEHTGTAVALLRQNLADHPNDAAAKNGLARALAATPCP